MTNDNAPPNPMKDKFEHGLAELIGMCHDAGLHTSEMIPALRHWLQWAEEQERL